MNRVTHLLSLLLQAGREAEEALASAWSTLEGTLHSQRTQLEAFTAEQAAGMQAWQEQMAQGLTSASSSLRGAAHAVQQTQDQAAAAAAQQDAALQGLEQDFQAQMLHDQVRLPAAYSGQSSIDCSKQQSSSSPPNSKMLLSQAHSLRACSSMR